MSFDSEFVAGSPTDYRVVFHADEEEESPRDSYIDSRMFATDGGGVVIDELTDRAKPAFDAAGKALAHFLAQYGPTEGDRVERAFHLWQVLTGDKTALATGTSHGHSQSDWHTWWMLAETEEYARGDANAYATWRFGDVFRYELFEVDADGNDGELIDSCGGFYDRESAKQYWVPAIQLHSWQVRALAADLARQAGLVGAGFVGVI